jgi:ribosomal protein S12 methylthiotransferase
VSDQIIVGFVSLGCAKNLVDSEVMLAHLAEAGCAITADLAGADVIVINTCGFLAEARDEALDVINEAAQHKQTGRCQRLVVVGCLVQRDREQLREAAPGIDVVLGANQREQIVQAVTALVPGAHQPIAESGRAPMPADVARLRLTPRRYAYLRISEGCDQRCTFCTIPIIRGPMRSKPPGVVLDEAAELVADGAVELNVIAQDTTAYGRDLDSAPSLAGLLQQLNTLDGVAWIRLMYAYPRLFDDDLINAVADCERVVKYVDLPLQHISDNVLRRMGRRVTRRETERLITRLRDRIPDVAIRTTLIVGFPGETEAEFDELLGFVRDVEFDALGVFTYSREPETPAARLPDHLPEQTKQQRRDALMTTQQAIAFAKADAKIGKHLSLLVESQEADGTLITRHAGQAPEVDSIVLVTGAPEHNDSFIDAVCFARQGYDLIARPNKGILNSKS